MTRTKNNKIEKETEFVNEPVIDTTETTTEKTTDTIQVSEDNREPIDIVVVRNDEAPITGALYIRQYSYEVHGPEYRELAAQFCTKVPKGRIGMYKAVLAHKIGDVEVVYREKKDADLSIDKQDPNAPVIDKVVRYSPQDKDEAVRFGSQKYDSSVIVSKPRPARSKYE